ncbi:unnamed protein product [Gongylonema pulchrum]|uniref:Uncharacterized protein n=1 Tax=Gongylonema pulchrum TaxID=637853 RepID=A0A3P6RSE1_9BILA|nr:unnamed protein product [Gongylonema pulchrum]
MCGNVYSYDRGAEKKRQPGTIYTFSQRLSSAAHVGRVIPAYTSRDDFRPPGTP